MKVMSNPLKASDMIVAPRAAIRGSDYAVQANTGHMPDGSGIQRHSAGELYPYVLIYRDSKVRGRKYDIGILGGKLLDTCWVPDSDTAISIIETLKGTA